MMYNTVDINNIEGIENYKVVITAGERVQAVQKDIGDLNTTGFTTLVGIIDDKSISLPFGVELSNPGAVGGGGIVGWINKGLDMLGEVVGQGKGYDVSKGAKAFNTFQKYKQMAMDGVQSLTGTNLSERQEVYSVVKPDSWSKPNVSFKCTFYKGMSICGNPPIPSFKTFCRQLAVPMLPNRVGLGITALMESTQVNFKDYFTMILAGVGKVGDNGGNATNFRNMGYAVKIGKILNITYGLWMTEAKVETPTIFDKDGQPLVWTVDFEFQYYKQPSIKEVQEWLL